MEYVTLKCTRCHELGNLLQVKEGETWELEQEVIRLRRALETIRDLHAHALVAHDPIGWPLTTPVYDPRDDDGA